MVADMFIPKGHKPSVDSVRLTERAIWPTYSPPELCLFARHPGSAEGAALCWAIGPVSYTHLTLPTIC
eukprot:6345478-Lingulodinium_polyedra.AAC.1